MSHSSSAHAPARTLLRSRGAVSASLLAILAGGAVTGGLLATAIDDPTSQTADRVRAIAPQVDPRTLSGPAYANAVAGTCLTWSLDAQDRVTDFSDVNCEEPHRFEVAGRIELAEDPGFGRGSELPGSADLAPVGTDRCVPLIDEYAEGREIDPSGRFTALVLPPSEEGWNRGDHAVLCGIATSELDGRSALSVGPFVEADQHRRWEPGTCLGFTDQSLPGAPVPCSEDHSTEIIADIDVAGIFPDAPDPPEPQVQAELTGEACHQAGIDFLGGDPESLRQSTLIATLVHPISQISWATGSRTVNCGLMKANEDGGFSVLRGSAQQGVLVDGETPVAPTTTAVPPPGSAPDDDPTEQAVPGAVPDPGGTP